MSTSRRLRALIGSSVVAAIAGCGGDSAVTPTAVAPRLSSSAAGNERTLAIELTTPSAADAGIIFSIEGPNIIGVAPADGVELVSDRVESHGRDVVNVLAVGTLRSGVIAWLTVQGVNSGNAFTPRVLQVAAGSPEGFVQRGDLSAYALTVER
jgi:hypothetical protein